MADSAHRTSATEDPKDSMILNANRKQRRSRGNENTPIRRLPECFPKVLRVHRRSSIPVAADVSRRYTFLGGYLRRLTSAATPTTVHWHVFIRGSLIRTAVIRLMVVVATACLCILKATAAADFPALFTQANRLYEVGKYGEPAGAYPKLIDAGRTSPLVFFNLGNSFFMSGR